MADRRASDVSIDLSAGRDRTRRADRRRAGARPPVAGGVLVVGGGVLLAATVLLWHIGQKPLWGDEIASVTYARRSVTGIFHVLAVVDAPLGGYYLLLHGWLHLTSGVAGLRALSAVFAVLALVVQALMVRQLFGLRTAAVSVLLLALNPFFVRYGQEVRPYSLVLLLDTLATWLFVRSATGGSRRSLAGYVAVGVLAVYAHLFAVLVLISHASSLPLLRRRRVRPRQWLTVYGSILLGCSPLLLFAAAHQAAATAYLGAARLSDLTSFATAVTGSRPVLVADGLLLAGGLVAARRRGDPRRCDEEWPARVLIWMLIAPPVLLLALALHTPTFADRYLIGVLVPLTVLVALVVTRLPAVPMYAAVAILGLLGARSVMAFDRLPYKEENLPAGVAFLMAHSRPGDVIGYGPAVARRNFTYYLDRYPGSEPRPQDVALAVPQPPDAVFPREVPVPVFAADLLRYQRVWAVGNPHSVRIRSRDEDMLHAEHNVLATSFTVALRQTFGGLVVTLYQRAAPP